MWKGDGAGVSVADKSGRGGGKVFFLSKSGAEPETVVVKIAGELNATGLVGDRIAAAMAALRASGAAGSPLAAGPDWSVEKPAGVPCAADFFNFDDAVATPERLAAALAEGHLTPVSWYEPYRAKTVAQCPYLEGVPEWSHMWQPTGLGLENGHVCLGANLPHPDKARIMYSAMVETGILKRLADATELSPASPAGRRVVTVHGDFKTDNVLYDAAIGACRTIDFDLTAVGPAAYDVAFACMFFLGPSRRSLEYRMRFAREYLKCMGDESAGDDDARALLFDAEVMSITQLAGMLGSVYDAQCPLLRGQKHYTAAGTMCEKVHSPDAFETIKLLEEAVAEVRASADLTAGAVDGGLVALLHARKAGSAQLWELLDELTEDKMLRLYGITE